MKKTARIAIITVVATAVMLALRIFFEIPFVAVSFIMTLFSVLTLYQGTLEFTPAFLEYLCHLNSGIKSVLTKYLVQENWDPMASKPKRLSEFGFKALDGVLSLIWLVIGSLALLLNFGPAPVMRWKCEHITHSIAMLLERLAGGFGSKLAVVVWILLIVLWIALFAIWVKNMYHNLLVNPDDKKNALKSLIGWNAIGVIIHIYGLILFSYGLTRFIQDLVFWIVVFLLIGVGIAVFLLVDFISK